MKPVRTKTKSTDVNPSFTQLVNKNSFDRLDYFLLQHCVVLLNCIAYTEVCPIKINRGNNRTENI